MQKFYFLPLSQVGQWPKHEIGSLSYHLGKLIDVQVKVAPGFVIPKQTLLQIAHDNHLAFTVQQWLSQQTGQVPSGQKKSAKNLTEIFSKLQVAPHISQQYLEIFYRTIPEKKVSVVASWLNPIHEHLWEVSPAVQGDATVFHTLLETWVKVIEATLDPAMLVDDEQLVPAAFLIQSYLKADLTGYVHTLHDRKSVYQVVAHLPKKIDPQESEASFLVDIRTWQIIQSDIPPQVKSAKLEKVFTQAQVLDLAQIAYRIKLHDLHQLQISWELADHEIYISNVERIADREDLKHQAGTKQAKLLLIGSATITGENNGVAIVMTGKLPEKKSFDQQILVIPQLDHISLNNIVGLKAVVTEQPLNWASHQLLQQYHIPVVTRVRSATKKVKTGQSLTVNGYTGRIFEGPVAHDPVHHTTISTSGHQVVAQSTQGWDHQEYPSLSVQGVIYQPHNRWLETGIHPLELLRSGHQQNLKNTILSDLTSFREIPAPVVYQLPSLQSDQLFKLKQGKYFETHEANPLLGFTGTTRLLHQSEWLDFELEVLTQAHSVLPSQLRIMLPPVRDPQEFSTIISKIKTVVDSKIWMPITYPSTVLELEHYLLAETEYFVVQTAQLLALAHGLDPEYADLLALYPFNVELLKTIVERILKNVKGKQVLLEVTNNYQALCEVAVELGLAGVVTPLSDVQTAQHLITISHHQVGVKI